MQKIVFSIYDPSRQTSGATYLVSQPHQTKPELAVSYC